MIKLIDAQIIGCISNHLKSKAWIRALSQSVNEVQNILFNFVDKTKLYADNDKISEEVLDLMAIELQTPNYSQDLELPNKHELIKNTLPFYSRAGTVFALKTSIESILKTKVEIHEWFENNYTKTGPGDPFHFKVKLATQEQIPKNISEQIKNIKRLSAHLDNIAYEFQTLQNVNNVAMSIMTSKIYNLQIVK